MRGRIGPAEAMFVMCIDYYVLACSNPHFGRLSLRSMMFTHPGDVNLIST